MKGAARRLIDKDELMKNIRVDIDPARMPMVTGYLTVKDIEDFPEVDIPSEHDDRVCLAYNYCPWCGRKIVEVYTGEEGGI